MALRSRESECIAIFIVIIINCNNVWTQESETVCLVVFVAVLIALKQLTITRTIFIMALVAMFGSHIEFGTFIEEKLFMIIMLRCTTLKIYIWR